MKTASDMEARKDTWTSLLVTLAQRMNRQAAAYFLATQGVPLRVAKRVLLTQNRRTA